MSTENQAPASNEAPAPTTQAPAPAPAPAPRERSERRGPRRDGRSSRQSQDSGEGSGLIEKVVFINRCAKVVKGGRRFSFAALAVVGDGKGKIGIGYGKANEVPDAIKKSTESAKKRMVSVKIKGDTIPHDVLGVSDGGKVLLKPASAGTGLIAGGGVRAVLEAAGIKNILTKSMGSNNHIAVVHATLDGLLKLRLAEEIAATRKSS